MKDLDFDELDKAVNSLIQQAPKDKAAPAKDKETVVVLPDATTPDEAPATVTPAKSTDASQTATPAAPSLATKRNGRFMDVVHPSSDMRTSSGRSMSRTGTNIQPMHTVSPEPSPETTASSSVAETTVSAHSDTDEVSDQPLQKHESWPDPLEMSASMPQSEKEAPSMAAADEEDADIPGFGDEKLESLEDTKKAEAPTLEPAPVASPFLPDAKVEKRPLGSAPLLSAGTEPNDEIVSSDATPEEATETSKSTSQVAPVTMPAELSGDVLAIEADKENSDADSHESASKQPSLLSGGTTTPAPAPSGPTSIAQQYTPQESSGDSTHTALYDTVAESHAMTHPAKKKSGWSIVVAIIALIGIGVAVGMFVYFFDVI